MFGFWRLYVGYCRIFWLGLVRSVWITYLGYILGFGIRIWDLDMDTGEKVQQSRDVDVDLDLGWKQFMPSRARLN